MFFSTKVVTVLVAAASIAPVLAAPFEELLRRDVNDALELMTREYGAHHHAQMHPHHPHRFHHRPQHHPHRPQHHPHHPHHPHHRPHRPHHRHQHMHHRPGHSRVQARGPKHHHGLKAHHKGHHGHKGRKHGHKGVKGHKAHHAREDELFARDLFEMFARSDDVMDLVARSGLLDELD